MLHSSVWQYVNIEFNYFLAAAFFLRSVCALVLTCWLVGGGCFLTFLAFGLAAPFLPLVSVSDFSSSSLTSSSSTSSSSSSSRSCFLPAAAFFPFGLEAAFDCASAFLLSALSDCLVDLPLPVSLLCLALLVFFAAGFSSFSSSSFFSSSSPLLSRSSSRGFLHNRIACRKQQIWERQAKTEFMGNNASLSSCMVVLSQQGIADSYRSWAVPFFCVCLTK